MKIIQLKITWKYLIAFYCIVMLYSSLHELVHHFSAYLICGEWGTKSFNLYSAACKGPLVPLSTYAGPIFSFIVMYIGAYFLNDKFSSYKKQLGFALIFAQMPLQRMVVPFFRMNDEYAATKRLFGESTLNYILVIVVVWGICLPPLIKAFRSIKNKNQVLWFLFYLVLFPYLLWGPFFMLFEYLMVDKQILAQPIIGIGLLFIINEIITIAGYFWFKKHIDPLYKKGIHANENLI